MDQLEMTKRDAGPFSFSIRGNGGVAPITYTIEVNDHSGQILDEDSVTAGTIDKKYVIWKPFLNKPEIRKDIEAGTEIPWAQLGERGRNLQIK
jgi:hypothetical protein